MPIQRPIPLWFGGHADAVLRRAAILGNGWMPTYRRPSDALESIRKLKTLRQEAGLSWQDFGIEGRVNYGDGNVEVWTQTVHEWREAGATHLSFNTMNCGFEKPDQHWEAGHRFAVATGITG